MPKTRVQKQENVKEIADKLSRAKSVVFADYRGLTTSQLITLRKALREQNAEFSVTKNNLLKLALGDKKAAISDEAVLEGPVATLFAYDDEISPIKTLVKGLKDLQIGKIKGGFLGDEYLVDLKINSLANLPSKAELQGKVVGVLAAPLQGMVSVLQGNLRNLVYALDQVRISKGGE